MREIENNLNNVNFKGIAQKPVVEETTAKAEVPVAPSEQKEIKDLKNMPAAELGRSQVASDSVETDLKFLQKHPQLVAELNAAMDKYAQTHSEEETMQMFEKMHQEFVAK
ncbi:hypothetical protein J6N69_03610 [bacterium]|nr:hypothetical protein [bacterium]MBP3847227.1 hypothetical protein [bacterium]